MGAGNQSRERLSVLGSDAATRKSAGLPWERRLFWSGEGYKGNWKTSHERLYFWAFCTNERRGQEFKGRERSRTIIRRSFPSAQSRLNEGIDESQIASDGDRGMKECMMGLRGGHGW